VARGELLRKLFLSHERGSEDEFRATAMEIIAEEQIKNNRQLARDLLRTLEASPQPRAATPIRSGNALPKDREKDALLVDVQSPSVTFDDIVLRQENKESIQRVIAEFANGELLRTHGLTPKNKILFVGPPGCGKTLCAKIVAHELGLPLLYTRFDTIVSSYLGETATNLRKVFDYATSGHWVVLFDEFDAIGKRRDDENEHGELKRVVNSFLQLLDAFSAPSLIVAATNHERLLDPALWRRFDEIICFPRPSLPEISKLIGARLQNFPTASIDYKSVANRMKGFSHADVERVCFDAVKTCIIQNRDRLDARTLQFALKQQKERLHLYRNTSKNKGI